MKNFFSRLGGILPKKRYMLKAIHSFSKRERIIFYVLVLALCVTTVAMLERINTSFMVGVPMKGGSISEGIIGTPPLRQSRARPLGRRPGPRLAHLFRPDAKSSLTAPSCPTSPRAMTFRRTA